VHTVSQLRHFRPSDGGIGQKWQGVAPDLGLCPAKNGAPAAEVGIGHEPEIVRRRQTGQPFTSEGWTKGKR
jgi:hypothetical protein